jgi:transcriptional regulator GlxA family with amidase domain
MDSRGSQGHVPVPGLSFGGPLSRWADMSVHGAYRSFSVQLRSAGTRALLGLPGGGLIDCALPLDALLHGRATRTLRAWQDAVVHAPGFAARVQLADEFLLRRARGAGRVDRIVADAVACIERTAGLLRARDLAAAVGLSERTLRRRFAGETGLAPKRYARIVRFRRAAAFLRASGPAAWPTAAARYGYVDQAHLIHDFGDLGGTTPARLDAGGRWFDDALSDTPDG